MTKHTHTFIRQQSTKYKRKNKYTFQKHFLIGCFISKIINSSKIIFLCLSDGWIRVSLEIISNNNNNQHENISWWPAGSWRIFLYLILNIYIDQSPWKFIVLETAMSWKCPRKMCFYSYSQNLWTQVKHWLQIQNTKIADAWTRTPRPKNKYQKGDRE